jgi:hypothetical protein
MEDYMPNMTGPYITNDKQQPLEPANLIQDNFIDL